MTAPVPSPENVDSAISVFDWITGKAGSFVIGAVGAALTLLAAAWKRNTGHVEVKAMTMTNADDIKTLQNRMDSMFKDYTMLSVAVAALPTRIEMLSGFAALREDIRTIRGRD